MREKPRTAMSTNNPLWGSEYNVITITTSDSIKRPDYNLSYNLSQNSLNLSYKSKIVEIEYSISISYWSEIQEWLLKSRQDPLYKV